MKKIITSVIFVFLGFAAILTIWSLLIPSTPDDSQRLGRMLDSAEHEQYHAAGLKEYERQVNAKVSSLLAGIEQSRKVNLALLAEAVKMYGADSEEVKKLVELKTAQNEQHVKTVSEILDKHGWLGTERIGAQNNYTLFAVMQDADFGTQDKYTGLMEQAVKQGTLAGEHFARFVDRRALSIHNRQIYGTCVTGELNGTRRLAPVADFDNVNKRRLAIGLKAIEAFAAENNIDLTNQSDS